MPLCSRTSQLSSCIPKLRTDSVGRPFGPGTAGGASLCFPKTQTAVNSQNGQELECSRRFLPHIWHQSRDDSRGGLGQPADQCQHVALLCDPGSHTACWVPGAVPTRTSPNPGRAPSSEGHLAPIPLSIRADTHPPGWETRGHRCHPWQRVKSRGRPFKPPGSQHTETGARAPAWGQRWQHQRALCPDLHVAEWREDPGSRKRWLTPGLPVMGAAPSHWKLSIPWGRAGSCQQLRTGVRTHTPPALPGGPGCSAGSESGSVNRSLVPNSVRPHGLQDPLSVQGISQARVLVARRLQARNSDLDPTLAATIREATGLGCWSPDLGPWLAVTHWHGNCLMLVWFPKAACEKMHH